MDISNRNRAIYQSILILLVIIFWSPFFSDKFQSVNDLSRVRVDLRMVATGLEFYHSDHGAFPVPAVNQTLPGSLTTPVAWFSRLPEDSYQTHRRYERSWSNWFVLHRLYLLVVFTMIAMMVIVFLFVRGLFSKNYWRLLPLLMTVILANNFLYIILKSTSRVVPNYKGYYLAPVTQDKNSTNTFHYFTDSKDRFVIQSYGPDSDRDVEDLSGLFDRFESDEDLKTYLDTQTYDSTNGLFSSGDMFRVRDVIH